MAEERLGLRGEDEVAAELGEEERPHAEAVAREEELAARRSQTANAKSPFSREAVGAPLARTRGRSPPCRSSCEAMPERLELVPQLDVVVDLAVLHHPEAAVLVEERLVATLEVDDREPVLAMPKRPSR